MASEGFEALGKSLGEVISERFSNPLITSFVLAWTLWNIKFFVILFSDNSVTETFRLAQEICFPNPFMSVFNGFVAPLTIAIAYIYYLPIPALRVYTKWKQTQKELNDIKQDIEGQTLLTKEESRELRSQVRELYRRLDEAHNEINKLRDDVQHADVKNMETAEKLRKANKNLQFLQRKEQQEEVDPVKATLSNFSLRALQESQRNSSTTSNVQTEKISESQKELMRLVDSSKRTYIKQIEDTVTDNPVLRDFDIHHLVQLQLLKRTDNSGGNYLELTQQGRQFLLENKLAK